MEPTINEGELVIAIKHFRYHPGDVVIARVDDKEIIKRVLSYDGMCYDLYGDNTTDSTNASAVSADKIKGKVLFK